jgi:hypothetical protein
VLEIVGDIGSNNAMGVPRIEQGLATVMHWTVGTSIKAKLGREVSVERGADFPFARYCVARKSRT